MVLHANPIKSFWPCHSLAQKSSVVLCWWSTLLVYPSLYSVFLSGSPPAMFPTDPILLQKPWHCLRKSRTFRLIALSVIHPISRIVFILVNLTHKSTHTHIHTPIQIPCSHLSMLAAIPAHFSRPHPAPATLACPSDCLTGLFIPQPSGPVVYGTMAFAVLYL